MVLPGVGPCRNSLIGDTHLLPSHTTRSGRTPCTKSHSQISIRISLLTLLLSPFFHYPCSDGEAVVINLKSDEAGKREQRRQGEREIRLAEWVANKRGPRLQETEAGTDVYPCQRVYVGSNKGLRKWKERWNKL